MNQRLEYGQPGFSWVLRTMGWIALAGALFVVSPAALLFGKVAALWALGALGGVLLTYAWLGGEAIAAWHGPAGSEPDSVPLPSES